MTIIVNLNLDKIEDYDKIVEKHKAFLEWQKELDMKSEEFNEEKIKIYPPECFVCKQPIKYVKDSENLEEYHIVEYSKGSTQLHIMCDTCYKKKRIII